MAAPGYVGQAYQRLFTRLGVPFRNLARKEVDYTETASTGRPARRERGPEFVINAAGYTGKPNVDACENDKAACLFGNAVLPGRIREACETTGTPWGHVSSGCIFTGRAARAAAGSARTTRRISRFRTNHCSFYSGTKALGEEVLAGAPDCYVWRLRIPFSEVDSPRNYLTKVMRYARLLEAANSLSPARRVRARDVRDAGKSGCRSARTT